MWYLTWNIKEYGYPESHKLVFWNSSVDFNRWNISINVGHSIPWKLFTTIIFAQIMFIFVPHLEKITRSEFFKRRIFKYCWIKIDCNGTPLQYFCLENPMDGGAWWATVHGVARVGHDWATSLSLFTFMHWRRKWQPTPVFLPGESQRWGSLVGCHLWGRKSRTWLKWLSSSSSSKARSKFNKIDSRATSRFREK